MTSVLRRTDQIGSRIRYFVTLYDVSSNPSGLLADPDVSAFSVPQGKYAPVAQIQDIQINAIPGGGGVGVYLYTGQLWRDLGRSLYVYASTPPYNSSLAAIYRQVMPSSGQFTEGVPSLGLNPLSYYVKTWSSTNGPAPEYSGVAVARVG